MLQYWGRDGQKMYGAFEYDERAAAQCGRPVANIDLIFTAECKQKLAVDGWRCGNSLSCMIYKGG